MSENIPYCRQHLGEEEIAAVTEVLRGGWIARGGRARAFEQECAERLDASCAIACSSGSAALEIALRGLGIGSGDEVIVPTLTWVATAMAVLQVGAVPVFCDVDAVTHSVTCDTVLAAWSDRTRAVIAVDFAGVPHEVFALRRLCELRGAFLVEDAAHAFGARYSDRTPVGRDCAAHVATFSFHPAKTITTAEGGLLTCADVDLAERLRRIRSGGITRDFEGSRGAYDYLATEVGSNFHMTELSAALGLVQLGRLGELLAWRRAAFDRILAALQPLKDELDLPVHPAGSSHNLFVVELTGDPVASGRRDSILEFLRGNGVMAHMHYPLLHRQPVFRTAGAPPTLPVAERYEACALTLPLFPAITPEQIARVAEALTRALAAIPAESVPTHAA